MSEDVRKNCRTQGKYSDKNQYCEDKRPPKSRDKRQKVSPAAKEPQEKKFHKRKSDGSKGSNTSLVSESESPVRYEENADHSFPQFDDARKCIEIKTPGRHVLSTTQNGESVVYYDPCFFGDDEAVDLLDRLLNTTNWHAKNIVINGVEYPQPRLVAWYGPFPYSYSGATLEPAEMPGCVLAIKTKVEEYLKSNGINVTLNSVLLNLYRHNKDSVSWHSDDEMTMGVCPTIASVSLGETRRFEMRRKIKRFEDEGSSCAMEDEHFVNLTHGSLLIMDGSMQRDWQHRVPKEYHDRGQRINLTFRTVYELENVPFVPDTESKYQHVDSAIRKSHRNKFNYDEENFPPLNTDTSPVCYKGIANSPNERNQDFSGLLKADDQILGSEEVWDTEPPSYNKTPEKTDDRINTSEEMWDRDSPCNITPIKTGDRISELEEEWEIASPCSKKNTILNNLNDDRKNAKIDIQSKNLHTYDSSLSSNNAINADANAGRNKNFSMKESHNVSSNSPVSNTEVKSERVQNKNLHVYESSFSNYNAMNFDTNAGKNKNFSMKESHGVSSNSPTSNTEVNVYEVKSEPMQMMMDMQNKNLQADNSTVSSYYGMNFDANAGKNRNFNMKESYTVSSKSSISNTQQNVYKVKDEPKSSTGNRWTPNVEAKEFVPINTYSTSYEKCTIFGSFGLENLLNYNIELMPEKELFDYSFALRDRVMEKIHEFRYTDELEILCQITDGNQTQKNQKIITTRMCVIVAKALKQQQTSPNIRKSFGNSRQSNHGNQNHYSERSHQGRNRGSYHRY